MGVHDHNNMQFLRTEREACAAPCREGEKKHKKFSDKSITQKTPIHRSNTLLYRDEGKSKTI